MYYYIRFLILLFRTLILIIIIVIILPLMKIHFSIIELGIQVTKLQKHKIKSVKYILYKC